MFVFVQNNTTVLSYLAILDELREAFAMPDAGDPFLAPNNKLGGTKCFIFFTFLQSDMDFGIVIPFIECLTDVISNKKSCQCLSCKLTSVDVRTVKFFSRTES